jgi:predicted ArsR family transcriptional regulator
MQANEVVLNYLSKQSKPMAANVLAKGVNLKPNTVGPALSDLYFDGYVDREQVGGVLNYRARSTKAPPRPRPGIHRNRKNGAKRGVEPLLKITIKGVELSEAEALEVYGALNRLFDRVTKP